MHRRSSDRSEEAIAGLVGLSLIVAAIVLAVIVIVAISLVTELGRIYKTRGFERTQQSRVLWSALAGLLGLWLVAGLLATNPATVSLALAIGCWGFFIFVLVCLCVEWYSRRAEPKVPKQLALADVVSWKTLDTTAGNAKVKENGHVPSSIAVP